MEDFSNYVANNKKYPTPHSDNDLDMNIVDVINYVFLTISTSLFFSSIMLYFLL